VNTWVSQCLAPARAVSSGFVVVLDRDRIVESASLPGDVVFVDDWWSLRCAYERHGRRRGDDQAPLAVVIGGDLASTPLPWDIEQASAAVASAKLPGPPSVRAALTTLDDDEATRAIPAVAAATVDEDAALLRAVTGVGVDGAPLSRAEQLRLAARLAVRPRRSTALAALARRWVVESVAASLLDDPPDTGGLRAAWLGYVSGASDEWATDLEQASAEISQLFAVGLLEPVVPIRRGDAWASVGVRRPSAEERARQLEEKLSRYADKLRDAGLSPNGE